jgi:hypothetical protein
MILLAYHVANLLINKKVWASSILFWLVGPMVQNCLHLQFTNIHNKGLFLLSLSSLFLGKARSLKSASFAQALALLADIRQGWRGLPRANILACYGRKKFYNIGP